MAAKAVSKLRARSDSKNKILLETPDLLERFLEASKNNPTVLDAAGVTGLLMSTISGAGETTATSITAVVYYLLKNRSEVEKLLLELRSAKITGVPSFADVNKLPYLGAAIKEGMRLFPTACWPMERKVPSPGILISGQFIPEGTSVGCMPSAIHLLNPEIWGLDVDQFRPDRWLEADPEKLRQMQSSHLGFSRGRRVCLGQHIAVMSMKKVIAALFLSFEASTRMTLFELYF